MVDISKKTLLFVEKSSLNVSGFISFLDSVMELGDFDNLWFCLDDELNQNLSNLFGDDKNDYWILDGVIDILSTLKKLEYIDTKSYFDFRQMFELISKGKFKKCYVLTQNENVFNALTDERKRNKKLKTVSNIEALHFEGDNLKVWTTQAKNARPAYFIDKDENIYKPSNLEEIEYVYSPNYRFLRLYHDDVRSGGEGKLFKTYQKMMCKVFYPEHISYLNIKKIQKMLSMNIFNKYVVWPKDMIYYEGNPIGYVMDEVEDTIGLDELRMDGFTGITEKSKYKIALNFLMLVNYLHEKGIVIGDLKPDNILVNKETNEVYLIDCGSYQIGDFPCVVYHPQYTKVKYKEEELRKFLRFPEDEYFAINKIIFEIIIGRTPNYNPDEPSLDNEKDDFLYPFDTSKIDSNTKRNDLKRWAMMSGKMRSMFYYYFTQGKVSYLPEWIDEIKKCIE